MNSPPSGHSFGYAKRSAGPGLPDSEWYTLRLIARGWELMHDLEQAELTRQAAAALELSGGAKGREA